MRERQDKRRVSLVLLVVLTVVLVFGQAIQSTYADSELDLNKTDVQISTPDTSKADNTNKDELNQDNEDQLKEKDIQLDLSNSRVVKDSSDISLNNTSRKRVTRAIAEIEKIDISVKAEWNAPYYPPITVNLMANGEQKDSVVLRYGEIQNDESDLRHVFRNFPKYDDDGNEIEYTITYSINDYWTKYKTVVSGNAQEGFIVKSVQLRDVNVNKAWNMIIVRITPGRPSPASLDFHGLALNVMDHAALNTNDNENAIGNVDEGDESMKSKREIPDFITVHLYADGQEIASKKIYKSDDWEGKFEDVPQYAEDGHIIDYTVKEEPLPGYIAEYRDDGIIINRSIIDVPVEKKWIGKRKDKIDVTLYRTYQTENWDDEGNLVRETIDEAVETVELNSANNWKHTFKDVYEFYISDSGQPSKYKYYVKETEITGYTSTVTGNQDDGYVITNENNVDRVSIPVEKKWNGDSLESVTVKLFADGEEVQEIELNKANNWKHIFANLQKYDNNNNEIKYTVKEVGEDNGYLESGDKRFKVLYDGSADSGFTILNDKFIPPAPKLPEPKTKKPPVPKPNTGDENDFKMLIALMFSSAALRLSIKYRYKNK
ncbi:MAG: Cna B-type domain-containing protein [Candidatus Nanosynbacter sp.]|nr:Cna B-type domain-containing protein [Candidatus Nanosynbacter sp.]